MPRCHKHKRRSLVCRSRRRQRERSVDCISNCPRYLRRTRNDLPQIERKAPKGIAGDPQAAREVRYWEPWRRRLAAKRRRGHAPAPYSARRRRQYRCVFMSLDRCPNKRRLVLTFMSRQQQSISETAMPDPLSSDLLQKMHAYWRAANYLSVGQIYLQDNPLLETPLRIEHIKPRLLGHWGTTTGLNFLYVHLNRLIKDNDLNMIYVIGPGHGGPGIVAHSYLEGSYTDRYPAIERSRNGLQRLFRQFSWPYGIPSHVSPETPGSIHEGGELGYSLAHAYGAAFDNPDLIVTCIIGDGEAETGALATSWHSNKFLNPARDGAVLPILHLNGFKIANPTVLARISRQELTELLRGYGYDPHFVEGDDPAVVHQSLAGTLDTILAKIRQIQSVASSRGKTESLERPRWPMIIFRTPKGWTGPKFVDGKPVEGTWRAHQVPISDFENPEHLQQLEDWLMSYRPQELFDERGKFREEFAALAPTGRRRMGSNPHANGGELLQPLSMPQFRDYAVAIPKPGS